jgi:hypothetical protein
MYEANEPKTKAVVSVSEMAHMIGLSRSRFHQLIGTTFPWPMYWVSNRRPFYDEELQNCCLEVRRRNCGIDGKPILFYARRPVTSVPVRRPNKTKPPKDDRYGDLLDGLKGLGLVNVTAVDVAEAIKQLYPQGMPEASNGEVLRAVFLHLRRQNTGNNVGK